jgi:phage tail protein X
MRLDLMNDGVSFEWESFDTFKPDFDRIIKARPAAFERQLLSVDTGWSSRDKFNWYGTVDGWKDVMHKTEHGWPELRQTLAKMLDDIQLEIPPFTSYVSTRRRKRVRAEHGDTIDMMRVYNGDLDHAWELPAHIERMAINTKRVTLVFDVTANGGIKNSQAMWRAALCMLLTDKLASVGRVFEVWVIDSTAGAFNTGFFTAARSAPRVLWAAWCVKRSNDPIVMDRLCAMLSIGFMRVAGFMAIGAGPWEPNPYIGSAYNRGLPCTLRDRRAAGEVVVRIGECYSKEEVLIEYARAWKEVEEHSAANAHVK